MRQNPRPSISVRRRVYDRLKWFVEHADGKVSCSGATEMALTRMLDDLGVPAEVPPFESPSDRKRKAKPKPIDPWIEHDHPPAVERVHENNEHPSAYLEL